MLTLRRTLAASLLVVSTALPAAAMSNKTRRGPTSHSTNKKKSSSTKAPAVVHTKFKPGQRSIDDGRATEIQQALVKAGYLSGEPSGHWDSATEAAVQKLQGDNGWQTKLVPDSRALIKLGLGSQPTNTTPAEAANVMSGSK